MLGNMPQLTGDAEKDVVALYDYVLALRRELYDLLNNLDDDNIRQITAKSIATDTLVVGDNIRMGDNAVISWGQVNDAPTVYSADDIRYTIITKEWIGTLGLKVGEQIEMGSNAIISWGQVTEQPFIPRNAEDVGALATNSPRLTWIGPTGIYTRSIEAEQILAGTLTGFTIKTAESGRRIEFGDNKYETYNADNQRHGVYMDALGGTSSFRIHDNGEHKFSLFYGAIDDTGEKMWLTSTGCPMKISSGVNDMSLTANKIWVEGDVHFGGAVTGLKVRLG